MENKTITQPEVRKRVWNYKIETLEKMKKIRDTMNISMPEVIDLAIEILMIETGLTIGEDDISLYGLPETKEFFAPNYDFNGEAILEIKVA
jgi:hypothetical protein